MHFIRIKPLGNTTSPKALQVYAEDKHQPVQKLSDKLVRERCDFLISERYGKLSPNLPNQLPSLFSSLESTKQPKHLVCDFDE